MTVEREEFQQLGDLTFELWGRIGGLDMMMRNLYEKWAREHPDPSAFLDHIQRELLNGMARQGRDDDSVEALLIVHAEAQIRDTIWNTKQRVA